MSKKGNSIKNEDISQIIECLKGDIAIYKNKLSSKNEALIIMRRELDTCQLERDQFKLMAEQVQQRYQDLRKSLETGAKKVATIDEKHAKLTTQQLNSLLHESREANKVLQFELDDMKRKLTEYQGDIKLLREQSTRQKFGMSEDTGISVRNFPQHEREALVGRIEEITDKYDQLSRDLEQCLDEKEELVTERDVYRTKYDKLNSEINYILKGESKEMIDSDSLMLENKLLKDQIENMQNERSEAMATMSKYKNLVEKRRSRASVPTFDTSPMTVSPVHNPNISSQTNSDLHLLIRGLIETINDKNLALSHQRKANNVLADRLRELEGKLKALEMSGLWNIDDYKIKEDISNSIEKLKQECDNMKMSVVQSDQITDENSVLIDSHNINNGEDLLDNVFESNKADDDAVVDTANTQDEIRDEDSL